MVVEEEEEEMEALLPQVNNQLARGQKKNLLARLARPLNHAHDS